MKLSAETVAHYARGAGFAGEAVVTATAIALATSGGLTEYHAVAGLPGSGDWRGLWGVNVDEYPQYRDVQLLDPAVAAAVAQELTATPGGFAWAGAYRNGHYRQLVDLARARQWEPANREQVERPYTVDVSIHRIEQARRVLHARHHGRPHHG